MSVKPGQAQATLALMAGVDVKIVSERLGHSSPLITWQTCQHVITVTTNRASCHLT